MSIKLFKRHKVQERERHGQTCNSWRINNEISTGRIEFFAGALCAGNVVVYARIANEISTSFCCFAPVRFLRETQFAMLVTFPSYFFPFSFFFLFVYFIHYRFPSFLSFNGSSFVSINNEDVIHSGSSMHEATTFSFERNYI